MERTINGYKCTLDGDEFRVLAADGKGFIRLVKLNAKELEKFIKDAAKKTKKKAELPETPIKE